MKGQELPVEDFFKIHASSGGKTIHIMAAGEVYYLPLTAFKRTMVPFTLTGEGRFRYEIVEGNVRVK
jgi:hypothetical protein